MDYLSTMAAGEAAVGGRVRRPAALQTDEGDYYPRSWEARHRGEDRQKGRRQQQTLGRHRWRNVWDVKRLTGTQYNPLLRLLPDYYRVAITPRLLPSSGPTRVAEARWQPHSGGSGSWAAAWARRHRGNAGALPAFPSCDRGTARPRRPPSLPPSTRFSLKVHLRRGVPRLHRRTARGGRHHVLGLAHPHTPDGRRVHLEPPAPRPPPDRRRDPPGRRRPPRLAHRERRVRCPRRRPLLPPRPLAHPEQDDRHSRRGATPPLGALVRPVPHRHDRCIPRGVHQRHAPGAPPLPRLAPDRVRLPLLWLGLSLGLALSVKWSAAFAALPAGLAVLWRWWSLRSRSRRWYVKAPERAGLRSMGRWLPSALLAIPPVLYVGAYLPMFLSGHGWGVSHRLPVGLERRGSG